MTRNAITARLPALGGRHAVVAGEYVVWFTLCDKPGERLYEGKRALYTRDRSKARRFPSADAHVEASRFLMIAGIQSAGFEPM